MSQNDRNDRDELVILRISLARIAQTLEVDNDLNITDLNYAGLHRLASTQERGWNDLAGLIVEEGSDRTSTDSHMRTEPVSDSMARLIAFKFVEGLRRDLTPGQFAEMCRRNQFVQPGICASHDFCDSNMVMEEAFHSLGLATAADMDLDSNPRLSQAHDDACALWNNAWEVAMPLITHFDVMGGTK